MKKNLFFVLISLVFLCSCSDNGIIPGDIQPVDYTVKQLMPTTGGIDTLKMDYLEYSELWKLFSKADTAFVNNEDVDSLMGKQAWMSFGTSVELQMEGDSIARGPYFTFKRIDRKRIELSVDPNPEERARAIHAIVNINDYLRPNWIIKRHFIIYQKGIE